MTDPERGRLRRPVLLILAGLLLVAVTAASVAIRVGGTAAPEPPKAEPGTVEHVDGVDRVVLTDAAVHRLAITTEPVREAQVAGATRRVIPYAAVLYDANGDTWTYTNPEPLVYVRQRVTVESIQGGQVVLTGGPAPGTAVVTVGAPELYGTEFGVSGDE